MVGWYYTGWCRNNVKTGRLTTDICHGTYSGAPHVLQPPVITWFKSTCHERWWHVMALVMLGLVPFPFLSPRSSQALAPRGPVLVCLRPWVPGARSWSSPSPTCRLRWCSCCIPPPPIPPLLSTRLPPSLPDDMDIKILSTYDCINWLEIWQQLP